MEIIKNIKNKLYYLFNKIISYSFSKLESLDKHYSISNNKSITKNINNNNNEEMYGQFIYFD
jgi:hypothetical protein